MSDPLFEPRPIHDHFLAIARLPHASGGEDPVRRYVVDEARRLGVEEIHYEAAASAPGRRNIVLRRRGRGPFAEAPWVTLQAHLDMVTIPRDDIFPLQLHRLDRPGAWVGARHAGQPTSLGADNGIGVATALAALADPALADYPLECLFTVQEETNLAGARELPADLLHGRRFINLDSEVLEEITYGSAGGAPAEYRLPLRRAAVGAGWVRRDIAIEQLRGGHSGIDINKGRANAVKLLARALARLDRRLTATEGGSYDLRLVAIGQPPEHNKDNAIPVAAHATVYVREAQAEAFADDLLRLLAALRETLQPVEAAMTFQVEGNLEAPPYPPLTEEDGDAVLGLLGAIPHGVLRMIPALPDTVETSTNLAVTRTAEAQLTVRCSNRSSNRENLDGLLAEHELIARRFGAEALIDRTAAYPAWQPVEGSPLLAVARAVYRRHYGERHAARVIHAGLECGYVVEKYGAEMECISIGPTIVEPHTIRERLDAASVAPFYAALCEILRGLFVNPEA